MQFSHTFDYDASPQRVFEMICAHGFRKEVCREQGVLECSVDIDAQPEATTVVVQQTLPADNIPAVARGFVGDRVELRRTEVWPDPAHGQVRLSVAGRSGEMTGTLELTGHDAGTTQRLLLDLSLEVPLVGRALEEMVAKVLTSGLETEQRVGSRWLAARG